MGLHRSDANLAVAQLENAAILLEDDYHVQYDGFDPTSPEGYIFFSMLQNAFLDQGLNLATSVQKYFKSIVNLHDRGVKQAGFLVLYKTTMPAVLIETGFISNVNEEKLLNSEHGQNNIALSIYKAVRDYKGSIEKNNQSLPDPETYTTETVTEPIPATGENTSSTVKEPLSSETKKEDSDANQVVFKVQFLLSETKINTSARQFDGIPDVEYYKHQGYYKYTSGKELSFDKAMKIRNTLVQKGYKDAFVVAFINDERIDINKARQMTGN
jgi:N-acetylmuramoyl-L-alanine amidase